MSIEYRHELYDIDRELPDNETSDGQNIEVKTFTTRTIVDHIKNNKSKLYTVLGGALALFGLSTPESLSLLEKVLDVENVSLVISEDIPESRLPDCWYYDVDRYPEERHLIQAATGKNIMGSCSDWKTHVDSRYAWMPEPVNVEVEAAMDDGSWVRVQRLDGEEITSVLDLITSTVRSYVVINGNVISIQEGNFYDSTSDNHLKEIDTLLVSVGRIDK